LKSVFGVHKEYKLRIEEELKGLNNVIKNCNILIAEKDSKLVDKELSIGKLS